MCLDTEMNSTATVVVVSQAASAAIDCLFPSLLSVWMDCSLPTTAHFSGIKGIAIRGERLRCAQTNVDQQNQFQFVCCPVFNFLIRAHCCPITGNVLIHLSQNFSGLLSCPVYFLLQFSWKNFSLPHSLSLSYIEISESKLSKEVNRE